MLVQSRSLSNKDSGILVEGTSNSSISSSISFLPLGKVNLIVLTDVHSWIAGHERHEPWMNVNYGDVLTFYQRLKDYIRGSDRDLFMVMNGDFMDGTGLSTIPPRFLTPLLEKMPFSVVNLGNHELYDDQTVDWIRKEFIPHWGGNYLTSNTILKATGEPLGNRYTFLKGDYSTLLVFGFLYNFRDNCPSTIVEQVQDVVHQPWFIDVLKKQEEFDVILVMAHMHVTDPLVEVIRLAIRKLVGHEIPIQFVTGHTHVRAFAQLDEYSSSFEAGRFLDTVGFCSFPTKQIIRLRSLTITTNIHDGNKSIADENHRLEEWAFHTSTNNITTTSSPVNLSAFEHIFLEPNRDMLNEYLAALPSNGIVFHSDQDSSDGRMLRRKIVQTQERLHLNTVVGCSSRNYELDQPMHLPQSLWGLYMYQIVPKILFGSPAKHKHDKLGSSSKHSLFVQGTAALRYNLFTGTVVLDDIIAVCPFNDTIYQVARNLTGQQILQILNVTTMYPNKIISSNSKYDTLPPLAVSTDQPIDSKSTYDLFTTHFHLADMLQRVEMTLGGRISDPVPVIDNTWNNPKDVWTTTNLWKSYIEQEWPCHDVEPLNALTSLLPVESPSSMNATQVVAASDTRYGHRRPGGTQQERPMTVVFFIAMIVFGLYAYQKRKEQLERSGYIPIGDPTTALMRSSTGSRSNLSYQ